MTNKMKITALNRYTMFYTGNSDCDVEAIFVFVRFAILSKNYANKTNLLFAVQCMLKLRSKALILCAFALRPFYL